MKRKHYWFGMEWSMAYYLGYNCKGKPLKPEVVFEVGGDIDFGKNCKIKQIYYLNKPTYCQNKPIRQLACLQKPWKCDNKTAKFIYNKYFGPRTPIEYQI